MREGLRKKERSSIEIEIAKWLFDRLVFGLFQAFGKLTLQDVVFHPLGFHGQFELGLHTLGLFAE